MNIISRKQAIFIGSKTYFTGKPCENGHVSQIYVYNNRCVQCWKEKVRKDEDDVVDGIKIYSHCEFCGKELTKKEKRIGAANHERCWKIHVDRNRFKKIMENRVCYNDEPSEFAGIYDDNGVRFKDLEFGE